VPGFARHGFPGPVAGQKHQRSYFSRRDAIGFSTETALLASFAVLLVPTGAPGAFTQTGPAAYRCQEPCISHEFIFGEQFTYRATTPEGVTEHSL